KDTATGRGDERVVRHESAASRHGWRLLRRLRDRSRTSFRRLDGVAWRASASRRSCRGRPPLATERAAYPRDSRLKRRATCESCSRFYVYRLCQRHRALLTQTANCTFG